jgi:hypothetical protein
MSFRSLYDNPLLATLLPCAVSAVVVALAQRKRGLVRAYATVFALAIAADAFLNGAWSPVKTGTAWATAVGVFFVIVGDFRYFVVFEESIESTYKLVRAAAWAFVVPVTAQLVRWRAPSIGADDRSTFLLYEVLFFALAAGFQVFRVPRARDARLARLATRFELVQYGTWIAADVGLSVTGKDVFYLVRLAANLLYYVAFVPVMTKLLEDHEAR